MSGPVIRNPTPEWLRQSPSVLDSKMEKAIKMLASLIGVDDPQSQVLGLMGPMEAGASNVSKAIAAVAKKLKPIKAYHGSPHDFDKFSLDKIGTGEGAQAQGHGLYFAEKPEVAETYKNMLSRDGSGRVYEVNIDADPSQFLDWDAPLNTQSDTVRQSLKPAVEYLLSRPITEAAKQKIISGQVRGRELYLWLSGERSYDVGSAKWGDYYDAPSPKPPKPQMDPPSRLGSMELNKSGIPGITYHDAGSRTARGEFSSPRTAGDDLTRNYVVFDDKLIEIVKKYGVLGALSAGLINDSQARQLQAEGY